MSPSSYCEVVLTTRRENVEQDGRQPVGGRRKAERERVYVRQGNKE